MSCNASDPVDRTNHLAGGQMTKPLAVLNYLVAEQYGQEPARAASLVLLGNLLSLVVIPVTLLFALPGL